MGQAGFGAEMQATRRARRLEQLRIREAQLEQLRQSVHDDIDRIQREKRAWQSGAEGERRVAESLEVLACYGWTALHDLHWPGRPKANLDHIVVGPGGIILIDAKNWTGDITTDHGRLRQNGFLRTKQSDALSEAVLAVAALLEPPHRSTVRGLMCFCAHDIEPTAIDDSVTVLGQVFLAHHIVDCGACLTPADVAAISAHLTNTLG